MLDFIRWLHCDGIEGKCLGVACYLLVCLPDTKDYESLCAEMELIKNSFSPLSSLAHSTIGHGSKSLISDFPSMSKLDVQKK